EMRARRLAARGGPERFLDLKRRSSVNDPRRFQEKQWGQIVARAWADDDFKARLLAHPKVVMREYGLEIDPEVEVSVVEDSAAVRHFVLPPNPTGDLSEEE